MSEVTLRAELFSPDFILKVFGATHSAKYLSGYLDALDATELLFESTYVDRHFIDDYRSYYVSSFQAPAPSCGRLHFFAAGDGRPLQELLDKSYTSDDARAEVERELQARYLGFAVRRPLSHATMGRTVLRPYHDDPDRLITVVRPYDVHLLGMRLTVSGLAYQQQDGGAAVCASTAMWSALQRVAWACGMRTPTPAAITHAADSPYAASYGLSSERLARAARSLDFEIDRFSANRDPGFFRPLLAAVLRSNIPVVLTLTRGEEGSRDGHAVVATGYRDCEPGVAGVQDVIRVVGSKISTVYVHDDNLGFHAHYELRDTEHGLQLKRGRSDTDIPSDWDPDQWKISEALVPKPRKLRMPVRRLLGLLTWTKSNLHRLLVDCAGLNIDALVFGVRLDSGISVQSSVNGELYEPGQVKRWHETQSLPRHVAVLEVSTQGGRRIFEFIFDATSLPKHRGLLTILCPGLTGPTTQIGHSADMIAKSLKIDPVFARDRAGS